MNTDVTNRVTILEDTGRVSSGGIRTLTYGLLVHSRKPTDNV